MRIESYRDLVVWKKAMDFVTEAYRVTRSFPRDEMFGLTSQIRRAASSIPANIAEGWGRSMTKEYVQFLRIARGSLFEVETHLTVARNLDYIDSPVLSSLLMKTEEIGKMTNGLIRSVVRSGGKKDSGVRKQESEQPHAKS